MLWSDWSYFWKRNFSVCCFLHQGNLRTSGPIKTSEDGTETRQHCHYLKYWIRSGVHALPEEWLWGSKQWGVFRFSRKHSRQSTSFLSWPSAPDATAAVQAVAQNCGLCRTESCSIYQGRAIAGNSHCCTMATDTGHSENTIWALLVNLQAQEANKAARFYTRQTKVHTKAELCTGAEQNAGCLWPCSPIGCQEVRGASLPIPLAFVCWIKQMQSDPAVTSCRASPLRAPAPLLSSFCSSLRAYGSVWCAELLPRCMRASLHQLHSVG